MSFYLYVSMEDFLTTISIEVADDELQLIKQHLDNCGITLPEFARQANVKRH